VSRGQTRSLSMRAPADLYEALATTAQRLELSISTVAIELLCRAVDIPSPQQKLDAQLRELTAALQREPRRSL
jgi:hypothetical protein